MWTPRGRVGAQLNPPIVLREGIRPALARYTRERHDPSRSSNDRTPASGLEARASSAPVSTMNERIWAVLGGRSAGRYCESR